MLAQLSVRNFRNFSDWYHFCLRSNKQYEFNTENVIHNIVNHSIIYGQNGSGKSNLGLALLDLTCHINEIPVNSSLEQNYLNADTKEGELAEFKYVFDFDGVEVKYQYGKLDFSSTIYEKLFISGECYIDIDRRKSNIAEINLSGTESLKKDLSNSSISVIKYIHSNAVLDSDNSVNDAFNKFISFVSGMVFFRTLNRNADYHGQASLNTNRLSKAIIDADKLEDFETFLNEAGVKCNLRTTGHSKEETIVFHFNRKDIDFGLAASTGTMSLGIFYYWWLKLQSNKLTFAYIDEFDAYYHYSLSQLIVRKLSEVKCQTVLTTHNLSILSNDLLRPDCYFLMADKQYPFYELVDKDLRKAHNLEKIFKGLKYGV